MSAWKKRLDTGATFTNRQTNLVRLCISEQGRFFSSIDRKSRGGGSRLSRQEVSSQGGNVLH
jgi:hypothetical protein